MSALPNETVGPYNITAIRSLLRDALLPEEIKRFCEDRRFFAPISAMFSPGSNQEEQIDAVIKYCASRLLFDELLAELQQLNPKQFYRYYDHLFVGTAPGVTVKRTQSVAFRDQGGTAPGACSTVGTSPQQRSDEIPSRSRRIGFHVHVEITLS